jgi:serine/threonine protein kinase
VKFLKLIADNQREIIPDCWSKELRDLVDSMLNIEKNQRITIQKIIDTPIIREPQLSSQERVYLEMLLTEKGKRLTSNIYRGSLDGFKEIDFKSRCDEKGPTVSLFKVQKNQQWIGGFTNV